MPAEDVSVRAEQPTFQSANSHDDGDDVWFDCNTAVDDDSDVTAVKCAAISTLSTSDPGSSGNTNSSGNNSEDFSHLQPVFDKLCDTLTDEERTQAINFIKGNADVFGTHEYDVGCTDLLTARIITDPSANPVAEPLRRHAKVHLDVIDDTVEKMKQAGIVEDACSPWCANLVVVGRKDDKGNPVNPRVTIDFRGLNAVTTRDRYPIPHLGDCLKSLDRAKYMSVIDLSNSFYQVPIDLQDRDKTAFVTRQGQFRLTRLGQGCTNSPAVFCRLMAMVLRGLTCCLAYIDDTICFSASFEQHLHDRDLVFDRFRKAKLKLKATKCKLFQTRCKFVGHYVSENGIEVDPAKIGCVLNWPFPQNVKELRSFLGLCGYYRSFVKGYANIAEPLTQCLRRDIPLVQTPERLAAFNRLKQALTSAPILTVPRDDPDCTYVIDSDASNFGAGCVLQQWQDGQLKVIEYASRTFNAAERKYCVTRRELAALIFGLKQFRSYLLGRKFQVRVDNSAIRFYKNMKDTSGQCARHLDYLSNFDFDIAHRDGAKHSNCDSLSRVRPCELDRGEPCKQCNRRITGTHSLQSIKLRRNSSLKTVPRRSVQPRFVSDGLRESGYQEDADAETSEPEPGQARPQRQRRVPRHLADFQLIDNTNTESERNAGRKGRRYINHGQERAQTGHAVAADSHHRSMTTANRSNLSAFADTVPEEIKTRHKKRRRRRLATVPSLQSTAPRACDAGVGDWSPEMIRDMQLDDPDVGPALQWVELCQRPAWEDVQSSSPMLRALWQQYASLSIRNGVLYRTFYDSKGLIQFYQLVIPYKMRIPFLELIHNDTAGHLKYAKCIQHITRRAWWLYWKRDLTTFIKCCGKCEAFHRGQPPRQGRLKPMIVGAPGERFAIDLCGPYPSSNGYKYIFTALCVYSKYGICVPIRNKEATTVAKALVEHVFLRYGLCSEILSDLGLEFNNEIMNELLHLLGVNRLRTSGYRPQTNGAVEVWHRTLHSMIAKLVDEGQRNWSSLLPYVTFCYNATEHSSTGFPPYFVFHGRMPLWTVDLVLPDVSEEPLTVPEYTAKIVDRLQHVSALVRENLHAAASSASNWYNQKARPKTFNVGDQVRVFYPRKQVGKTTKWQSYYKTQGHITQKLNDVSYIVSSPNWKENKIVHVDKLRPVITVESRMCNRVRVCDATTGVGVVGSHASERPAEPVTRL